NPAQFAPHEDLSTYPRTLPSDISLLRSLTYRSLSVPAPAGLDPDSPCVHAVLAPPVSEMYPSGITTDVAAQQGTFVEVKGLSHQLEGSVRPHFFRGVATVVTKLLNAVSPDVAIFGQKDAQQCVVVRRMVRDLLLPTRVVVAPTTRDPDGLAMSSRNAYLDDNERQVAPVLYRALRSAQGLYDAGETDAGLIVAHVSGLLRAEASRLAAQASPVHLALQYVAVSDPETLEEVDTVVGTDRGGKGAIVSAAVVLGRTRLIDNVAVGFTFE
ncbi:pantothenate synthase, partial [Gonapodya sp. JEL0774]